MRRMRRIALGRARRGPRCRYDGRQCGIAGAGLCEGSPAGVTQPSPTGDLALVKR